MDESVNSANLEALKGSWRGCSSAWLVRGAVLEAQVPVVTPPLARWSQLISADLGCGQMLVSRNLQSVPSNARTIGELTFVHITSGEISYCPHRSDISIGRQKNDDNEYLSTYLLIALLQKYDVWCEDCKTLHRHPVLLLYTQSPLYNYTPQPGQRQPRVILAKLFNLDPRPEPEPFHILQLSQNTPSTSSRALHYNCDNSVLLSWCFHTTSRCLLQGRCNREKPACKYFHPPQHLKVTRTILLLTVQCSSDNNVLWLVSVSAPVQCPLRVCVQDQLLINGRNHLALKNALAQQMQQQIIPGQVPAVVSTYTNYTVLYSIQFLLLFLLCCNFLEE